MTEDKNIHDLELHEITITRNKNFQMYILRVPGGWIYSRVGQKESGVFVPYSKD